MISFNTPLVFVATTTLLLVIYATTATTHLSSPARHHVGQVDTPVNKGLDHLRRLREIGTKLLGPQNPDLVDFVNDGLETILGDIIPSPYQVLRDEQLIRDSIDLGVCDMGYEATATSVKVYDLHKHIQVKEIEDPVFVMDNILQGNLQMQTTVRMELLASRTTADIIGSADCGDAKPMVRGNVQANIAGDYEMTIVATVVLCDEGVQLAITVPSVDVLPRVTNVDLSLDISCDYKWYEVHVAALCAAVNGAYGVLEGEIEDQTESMLNNAQVKQLVDEVEVTVAAALEEMIEEQLGDLAATCNAL